MPLPRFLNLLPLAVAIAMAAPIAAPAQPAAPATAATRFLSVETLSAPPPAGLTDWAAAAARLDAEFAVPLAAVDRLPPGPDAARQRQALSERYDTRNRALFAPLVLRLRAVAARYAKARKLPDLRLLTADQQAAASAAGARDVTADFVAWAAKNPG